jgi:hypothetical protein
MRKTTIAVLGTAALSVAACGSSGGGTFADKPSPPAAVNLTVYVSDSKVSISPASIGAGPVVFIVTNQGSKAHALAISAAGGSHTIASTAPINPQGTTQVSVDFSPGDYTIATASHGSTDAALSEPASIRSVSIHIGRERQSSSSSVLQP